jgi:hypothetical protein
MARAKRRCMHGKRRRRSPLQKNYDFTKKREFGEGEVGKKIASAVTPKSLIDLIPTSKVVKAAKAMYNYLKS